MTKKTIPYPYLDTPVCLLDLNKLEANIKLIQQAANEAGIKLRPHTKVHESAYIAKMQLEAGERQEALYFLQGESPCWVRFSQPPIPSVASKLVTIR